MKCFLITPLLISLSFLNSGFIFKKSNIKELYCEGSIGLSLLVDIKTGQRYRRMGEVFDEIPSNTIIPFDEKIKNSKFIMKSSSSLKSGLFRSQSSRTFLSNGVVEDIFIEVNFNDMSGKMIIDSSFVYIPYKRIPTTIFKKCEFRNLDKELKIKS
ncbi:hypothetical protein [uncultured Prochlorococcus sp.]|uniref:hypothetical protein n=1 Tax=uncultured Prochlorococcus sp. TaxID=159733 RepID=UPI0025857DFA|nr:hypothetical protein [uncultured Prochlorococcus sp.]